VTSGKKKTEKKKKEEIIESISDERDRLLECLSLPVGEFYTKKEISERWADEEYPSVTLTRCYNDYMSMLKRMDATSSPVASDLGF
jgi:hypothetical protein